MFQSNNSNTHGPRLSGTSENPGFSRRALTVVRTVVLTLFCLVPLALGMWSCNDDDRVLQRYPSVKSGDGSTVGGMGGTVNFVPTGTPGVEVDLTFPAGAVPKGTVITVEESDSFPLDPAIDMIPGLVFEFGPDGIVFGAPVKLTITYDPSALGGIDPEDIRIFKTVSGGTWEALATTLDATAHTLSAMMPGFTGGGAGVPDDLTPPETRSSPVEGHYTGCLDVYLTCDDDDGDEHGCKETYYKTIEDTVPEAYIKYVYETPITLAGDTTLRFFSEDWYYNREGVIDREYIVSGCGNSPPANTTAANFINAGADSTSSLNLSLVISATDDIGVTAYLIKSDSSEAPDAEDPDWVAITSTTSFSDTIPYTHPDDSEGLKTVYVFFKDGSDRISAVRSDTITYTSGGGPAYERFVDFEYMPSGQNWAGGGAISRQYSAWGVIFDFSGASVGGGRGVPWVERFIDNTNGDHHMMTNDKNSQGRLNGVIHIIFSVNPSDVSFYIHFPDAIDTVLIEALATDGQLLPGSAIGWADGYWPHYTEEPAGHDITISWPNGIREIRLHAAGFGLFVDDVRFSGGEE